ncbi:TPA: hypothetical protein ON737_001352 [Morganella morganii]|nr:hypothetical protein [Morganella morganii]HCR3760375.1 hypothetical protein [Morganella morganii]HCT5325208.1 hypothetical protein [Morganella morganii]
MIEKPIYYISAERPTVEENYFLLRIVSITGDGGELLCEKKFVVKPTRRQVREFTKLVINHIKQIQG